MPHKLEGNNDGPLASANRLGFLPLPLPVESTPRGHGEVHRNVLHVVGVEPGDQARDGKTLGAFANVYHKGRTDLSWHSALALLQLSS